MSYRLLALDLDGTLLRHDQRVDDDDHRRDPRAAGGRRRRHDRAPAGCSRAAVEAARTCAIDGVIACVEGSHLVELASNTHAGAPSPMRDRALHAAARRRSARTGSRASCSMPTASTTITRARRTRATSARGPRTCASSRRSSPGRPSRSPTVAIGEPDAVAAAHALLRAARRLALFSVSFAVSAYPGKHAVARRAPPARPRAPRSPSCAG